MKSNDHTWSARLIGAAFLCLGLAVVPMAASACDMNAVEQELARQDQATPQTVAANTVGAAAATSQPAAVAAQHEQATAASSKN